MLQKLKSKINRMRKAFEGQLNSNWRTVLLEKLVMENRDYLKTELVQKTKEIQDTLDMEMGHVLARFKQMEAKIDQLLSLVYCTLLPLKDQ